MKEKRGFRHNDHRNDQNNNHNSAINTLKNAMKEAANPTVSRFYQWDSNSMKALLVENNVQIRGSANASHETLVRICDEVFGPFEEEDDDDEYYYNEEGGNGKEDRERSGGGKGGLSHLNQSFTFEDLTKMNWAATRIQKLFISSRKKMYEKMYSSPNEYYCYYDDEQEGNYHDEEHQYYCDDTSHPSVPIIKEGEEEIYYEHAPLQEVPLDKNYEEEDIEGKGLPSMKVMSYADGQSYSLEDGLSSHESLGELDEELDTVWRKPSWKFAKKFEAENRPHKSGKAMEKYSWKEVTLGRHCTMGGCGEQLDLWNEGATSEFSQFGSGITNYFKVCSTKYR